MTILGTLFAIGCAIAVTILLGPYGAIVLLACIFGLVWSTHQRNKKMYGDIQRIKEKLGIQDRNDFDMPDSEIEEELAQWSEADGEEYAGVMKWTS